MMQFVFPALAWGFLLMAVPILIHLINLLRHRRQPWAAMEFLLESYRKHRRWVWLKQFLLLLSRIIIMGLLVAMLAQWVSSARWLAIFGESVTHHYVLLDDSYSMSDLHGNTTSYQKGLAATQGLLRQAISNGGSHQVTLIRWSKAHLLRMQSKSNSGTKDGTEQSIPADAAADVLARTIPRDPTEILERLNGTSPSNFACDAEDALSLVLPLAEASPSQQAKLYLVSDFRKKDWAAGNQVKNSLEAIQAKNITIDFIDCADAQHQNLSIIELVPEDEIQAAGVPMMMRIQVKNHGSAAVRNVQIRFRQLDYGASNLEPLTNQSTSADATELPTLVVDQIQPGETITRRFQVLFPRPAWQGIQAFLPDDAIAVDNVSSAVVHVQEGQRVLLVDGAADQHNAFFVEAAINPSLATKTGLLTTRIGTESLREQTDELLAQYACIYLLDVPILDKRTLDHLKRYVDRGGGIAIIFGENSLASIDHLNNEWFSSNDGLANVRLEQAVNLPAALSQDTADVLVESHPIFQALLGLTQSPFQMVRVSKYFAVKADSWKTKPEGKSNVKALANLRNGEPWIMESYRGQGRVVVVLGGLGREWTNWPQDPTFVVSMLKMVGYLGSFRQQETSHLLGTPVEVVYSNREVLPEWEVLLPSLSQGQRAMLNVNARQRDDDQLFTTLGIDLETASEDLHRAIFTPGIVEVWSTLIQGQRQVRNIAYRVSSVEGDLNKPTPTELLEGLRPLTIRYRTADDTVSRGANASLASRATLLMSLLIGLLLVEQVLAWSASYHLPSVAGGGRH